jgi:hypothetical protein
MKKRNLVLRTAIATAVLAMAAGAQAGALSGGANFATENFGPTSTAALAIKPVPLVYTFSTPGGIVVNNTGVIYAYLRLNNATFTAAPASAEFALGGGIPNGAGQILAQVVALSTDKTTVKVSLTNQNAANIVFGVGGTLTYTPAAASIAGGNTVLNTAGNTLTAQTSISVTNAAAFEAVNTLPAELDGGLSTAFAFATAKVAITPSLVSSATFAAPETAKIDLTAASPGSRFTVGLGTNVLANLGSVTFTDVAGVNKVDGSTAYTIAGTWASATALSGTVTGVFKTGATGLLSTATNCGAGIAAGSVGALNAGLTTLTFTAATTPTTATPIYVCYSAPATVGAIPTTTPTGSFSIAKGVATDAVSTAAGNLYGLNNNGQTVDVRSYIPVVTVGYTSFVRVINTGAVSASVTGQWLYGDGTTSAAAALTTLQAGGSVTLTSAQVETALGVPNAAIAGNRPRLRLSGPTNGLQAQSFILSNANGNFGDATGAQ